MTALACERMKKRAGYYRKRQLYFSETYGVGLGNFDGLHIGHMALINTLIVSVN